MALKEKWALVIICAISSVVILVAFSVEPISQNLSYHQFSDSRKFLFLPNFFDVISNLPFFVFGLLGLKRWKKNRLEIVAQIKEQYFTLFFGLVLLAFGSGYYHLWPNNQTLVWDRIPMTLIFMSLFSIIVAEFISVKISKRLFGPLLLVGVASVIYWHISETNGQGDLRLYALVQFLPVLIIPIILLGFKSDFSHAHFYWLVLCCYLFAKIFEHFDEQIFSNLGFISGHSLKHLCAGLGVWLLVLSYTNRQKTH